jgi:hypothetical protein
VQDTSHPCADLTVPVRQPVNHRRHPGSVRMSRETIALAADTIHNLSDALTAVRLWIAFADTYGVRRAEDLVGRARR